MQGCDLRRELPADAHAEAADCDPHARATDAHAKAADCDPHARATDAHA